MAKIYWTHSQIGSFTILDIKRVFLIKFFKKKALTKCIFKEVQLWSSSNMAEHDFWPILIEIQRKVYQNEIWINFKLKTS